MSRLFISNLPWDTTDEELEEILQDYGVSSAKIIRDRETGKSRGFGFADVEEAEQAKAELNGAEYGGRAITVKDAIDKAVKEKKQLVKKNA